MEIEFIFTYRSVEAKIKILSYGTQVHLSHAFCQGVRNSADDLLGRICRCAELLAWRLS